MEDIGAKEQLPTVYIGLLPGCHPIYGHVGSCKRHFAELFINTVRLYSAGLLLFSITCCYNDNYLHVMQQYIAIC